MRANRVWGRREGPRTGWGDARGGAAGTDTDPLYLCRTGFAKDVPEPQGFVPSTSDNGLSIGGHGLWKEMNPHCPYGPQAAPHMDRPAVRNAGWGGEGQGVLVKHGEPPRRPRDTLSPATGQRECRFKHKTFFSGKKKKTSTPGDGAPFSDTRQTVVRGEAQGSPVCPDPDPPRFPSVCVCTDGRLGAGTQTPLQTPARPGRGPQPRAAHCVSGAPGGVPSGALLPAAGAGWGGAGSPGTGPCTSARSALPPGSGTGTSTPGSGSASSRVCSPGGAEGTVGTQAPLLRPRARRTAL